MAIYDNQRLIVKVCKLFYEDNMSQKDISSTLGISKPQVCRMLNFAKENMESLGGNTFPSLL
ncbi:MAG TPA: hypothetical protein VHP38_11945 [Ruminiclostridium sp.]|nr:hypothetical protein [Ruminiclostridium sp.]